MNLPRMRESCIRLKEPGGVEWKEPPRRSFTEEYKRQAIELAVWRRRSHRRPKRARICTAQCCGAECRTPDMSSRSIKDCRNAQSGATICVLGSIHSTSFHQRLLHILKSELVHLRNYKTRTDARRDIHLARRHSTT